jgi:GT2 family glycosyltransferase
VTGEDEQAGATGAAPALTVVIVTWNSADTIGACLASLQASTGLGGVETIIVDNASSDETCALIDRDFPATTLIRNNENSGFARANNMPIAAARAETLLLLNPDVILTDPAALSKLAAVLTADPAVGLVGGRLVFHDGRHQVGDAGFAPNAGNMIRHGLGLGHLVAGLHGIYLVRPDRSAGKPMEVDWLCGACLMVRREAIRVAGPLDESLFLYAEDVEFGCRLRRHGWRAVYLPDVRIVHLQGKSEAQAQAGSDVPEVASTRWLTSLLQLHARLYGRERLWQVQLAFAAGFMLRAAAYEALALIKPKARGRYKARAAALWRYGLVAREGRVLF